MFEIKVRFKCGSCQKMATVIVECESQSDYYFDSRCDHCNKPIEDSGLDTKIMNEVSEFFCGMFERTSEFYNDLTN